MIKQEDIINYITKHPGSTESEIMEGAFGFVRKRGNDNKKYADCLRRALRHKEPKIRREEYKPNRFKYYPTETKQPSIEKEIIGYKLIKEIPNFKYKVGDTFDLINDFPLLASHPNFKPIYKPTYSPGDWVIIRYNNKDLTKQIKSLSQSYILCTDELDYYHHRFIRLATQDEINLETLSFSGYKPDFIGNKKLKFGCKEVTKDDLTALLQTQRLATLLEGNIIIDNKSENIQVKGKYNFTIIKSQLDILLKKLG